MHQNSFLGKLGLIFIAAVLPMKSPPIIGMKFYKNRMSPGGILTRTWTPAATAA